MPDSKVQDSGSNKHKFPGFWNLDFPYRLYMRQSGTTRQHLSLVAAASREIWIFSSLVLLINIVIIFVDEEHRGGRFFFKAVKEGDQVLFATEEELERQIWVNKLYTATGQSHKPVAPNLSAVSVQPHVSNTLTRLQGGWSRYHCFFRNIYYSFKIVHRFWLAPIPG